MVLAILVLWLRLYNKIPLVSVRGAETIALLGISLIYHQIRRRANDIKFFELYMQQFKQLALGMMGTKLCLQVILVKSVQAASFNFDFAGKGQGSLKFDNTESTGLKGEGLEFISLDILQNSAKNVSFGFSFPISTGDGSFPNLDYGDTSPKPNVIFHFSEGNLSGIDLQTTDITLVNKSEPGYSLIEKSALVAKNDRFREPFTKIEKSENESCYPDMYQGYSATRCDTTGNTGGQNYKINDGDITIGYPTESYYIYTAYIPELNDSRLIDYYYSGDVGNYFTIPFDDPYLSSPITFTTIDSIASTTSTPEPQIFSIFGLGTVIGSSFLLKRFRFLKK